MDYSGQLDAMLRQPAPVLALAPMQDVTDLPFWKRFVRILRKDSFPLSS